MQSHSQAGQDCFPRFLVKPTGTPLTYLDIGSHAPTVMNNSYALEKEGWNGLSIDLQDFSHAFKQSRQNPFRQADATTVRWETLLTQPHIDYLSFDIDDATEQAFDRFPWESYRFSTITLEHDQYRVGTRLRNKIRTRLQSLGYVLVCADVIVPGYGPFEDWFVYPDPTRIYADRIDILQCASCPFQEILDKMNAFLSR